MADLIAWLDAQERKPFSRVAPMDETVEAFDPLHRGFVAEDFAIPTRILEIYGRGEQECKEEVLGCGEPENGALHTISQNLLCLK